MSSLTLHAQINDKPRKTAVGLISYKTDSAYFKLTYGKAKSKAVSVFGYEIPWRKLWRFGEDDATELTITADILLAEQPLQAGTYALFAIPDTAGFTIVVNTEQGQWGLYKYNPKKDVFRVKVPVYVSPKPYEELTFYFEPAANGVDLVMIWASTAIRIPMRHKRKSS